MKNLHIIFALSASLLLFSCNMVKREYRPGYYVQKHNHSSIRNSSVTKNDGAIVLAFADPKTTDTILPATAVTGDTTPMDTIITLKRSFHPSDTILCRITKISSRKITYISDDDSTIIPKAMVKHTNVPLYSHDKVERMARRSKNFGRIGLYCGIFGILLAGIPWIFGVYFTAIAAICNKKALEEINKRPNDYSSDTKEEARIGARTSRLGSIFWIIFFILDFILMVTLFSIALATTA